MYTAAMPRMKRKFNIGFGGLEVSLGLDIGARRRVSATPANRPGRRSGIRRRLRGYAGKLGKKGAGKPVAGRSRAEEKSWSDSVPGQPQNAAGVPTFEEQTHGLPEPDSTSQREVFQALISRLKPGGMLDLGCGHGFHSLTATRLGWKATAVDARTTRWPDPEAQESPRRAELIKSVRWVQTDVREFPIRGGEYDLICILGLLHHLQLDEQIELLERCSGSLTLIDTRIAPEIVDTVGNYEGHQNRQPGETREERDDIFWAAWGNEVSFWHTEESLLRLLRDCGYGKVMPMRPPHRLNYTFYLCLPDA